MSRTKVVYDRKHIDVWVLMNQYRDLEAVKVATGKSYTDQIIEALALYHNGLHKAGVI
jgi:hypothetical protein